MPDQPAIRRDPVSGQEVIFAAHRQNRPHQHAACHGTDDPAVTCPFCPGNEALLTDIVWQREEEGRWLSRAITNLYPVISPPAGRHEVVIETPHHSLPPGDMTPGNWRAIVTAWGARFHSLSRDWDYVALFRNVGSQAGASLEHPHSQLIAFARTPAQVLSRRRRLRQSHRKTGQCSLCIAVETAGRGGSHLVTRTASYAAIVPAAAEVPFEVWIVPIEHASAFVLPGGDGQEPLARILHDVFRRLSAVLGDFDHNMMLADAAHGTRAYLHWFLRIRPVAEPIGGLERSTGMAVNPSHPERDAAALRNAAPPQVPS